MIGVGPIRAWRWMAWVLAIGSLGSIFLRFHLSYNSYYFDESGYLFVGNWLLDGFTWPTKSYVFSADFPLILLSLFDRMFDAWGGRIFSALAGALSLLFIYLSMYRLGVGNKLALATVLLIGLQPSHIIISRMATYDALCFCLVALSFWAVCEAIQKKSIYWAVTAGLVTASAVLSKYIVVVYVPLITVILGYKNREAAFLFLLVSGLILLGYFFYNFTELQVLYDNQISGSHAGNSSVKDVAAIIFRHLWPLLMIMSLLIWWDKTLLRTPIFLICSVLSLPLMVYHWVNQDMISLYKHMVYPASVISALIIYLWRNNRNVKHHYHPQLLITCGLLGVLVNSVLWVKDAEHGWPNTQSLLGYLNFNREDVILSEDPYLFRYHYYKDLTLDNIYDTTWVDFDKDGHFSDNDVYTAVEAQHFTYVYLDRMTKPKLTNRLMAGPLRKYYTRIYFRENLHLSHVVNAVPDPILALYVRNDRLVARGE